MLHDYSGPRKSSIFPGYEANNHKEVSNTMQKISEDKFSREKAQSQRWIEARTAVWRIFGRSWTFEPRSPVLMCQRPLGRSRRFPTLIILIFSYECHVSIKVIYLKYYTSTLTKYIFWRLQLIEGVFAYFYLKNTLWNA